MKSLRSLCCCGCVSVCACGSTSARPADVTVLTVWVTAKLLQAVDGALSHHRFPSEGSMVDNFQHNGRSVHLLFGKELGAH